MRCIFYVSMGSHALAKNEDKRSVEFGLMTRPARGNERHRERRPQAPFVYFADVQITTSVASERQVEHY
jgi:hypothetical protein